jgi:hypothetical protein
MQTICWVILGAELFTYAKYLGATFMLISRCESKAEIVKRKNEFKKKTE